jgi:hypothetical protein
VVFACSFCSCNVIKGSSDLCIRCPDQGQMFPTETRCPNQDQNSSRPRHLQINRPATLPSSLRPDIFHISFFADGQMFQIPCYEVAATSADLNYAIPSTSVQGLRQLICTRASTSHYTLILPSLNKVPLPTSQSILYKEFCQVRHKTDEEMLNVKLP